MKKHCFGLSTVAALFGLLISAGDGQIANAQSAQAAPAPHIFPTREQSAKRVITLSPLKNKRSGPIMFTTPGTTPNGITYNGGPVMLGAVHVYIIWYGNWAGNSATTILPDLAAHIGGSPYYNINTSYDDSSSNHVANAVSFAGSTTDNYSRGTSLSDADVQGIVSDALLANSLPTDTNGVYFVVTSSDVSETSGFCSAYCGWHTHATLFGSDIKYSFVGDAAACPSSCAAQQSSSPNGNIGADGMASVLAHELEESATDPDLNAWYSGFYNENADMCAWTFGTEYTAPNGSRANMRLGSRDYLIQQNWLNATGGLCAQAAELPTLTATAMPYAVGWSAVWPYGGSLSPSSTADGNAFKGFVDGYGCGGFGCSYTSTLTIAFASNPGAGWLKSVSANGVTKTGASATYSYTSGSGIWTWSTQFGFVNGNAYPVTIVRK